MVVDVFLFGIFPALYDCMSLSRFGLHLNSMVLGSGFVLFAKRTVLCMGDRSM